MRKGTVEKTIRRNITMPTSYAQRLEVIKRLRGGVSDSEAIRDALDLLLFVIERKSTSKLMCRDNKTGVETELELLGL
ncbi:MAG TPA: ribbon-helix-helix protein, CopG family [Rhizomicrobium sp.]|nr:ribbon-helix-helix protein, CopG family [Rhizomicrobium sp.]